LQTFSQALQLPIPSSMAMLKTSDLGEGLDGNGAAAMFFVQIDEEDIEPASVLLLPAPNYAGLIKQGDAGKSDQKVSRIQFLGSTFAVRKLGPFAALAQTQHEKILESLTEPAEIPAEVRPLVAWIDDNDVAAVLMQHGIKVFATYVQTQISDVKETLSSLGDEGQVVGTMLAIYDQLFGLVKKEASALSLGLKIEPGNTLRIASRLRAQPQGKLTAVLSQIGPANQDLLSGLPQNDYVLALGGRMPEGLSKALLEWSTQMMVQMRSIYGLNEAQARKMAELSYGTLPDMKSMNFLLAVGQDAKTPLLHGLLGTIQVTDSKKFLQEYLKQIKDLTQLVQEAKTDRLGKTEAQKVQIQGLDAVKVVMTMPQLPGPGPAQFGEIMQKLFGADGKITAHVVAVDRTHIAMIYGNQDLLGQVTQVLKGSQPGLPTELHLAKTAALLPKQGQMIGYWSLPGTIGLVNRAIVAFGLDQQGIKPLPEPPAAPPIGFAVTVAPEEIQKEVVIPGELLQKARRYVIEVIMAMQGQP